MIKFTKMEGIGNDYVYINTFEQKVLNPSELSKKISDRHFGVGSDGLILIGSSDIADFKMSIYNSDGSQAEMCGNGIRCVAKYVYDKGLTDKTEITIETLAGVKKVDVIIESDKVSLVKVDMGEPILKADKIPVINYTVEESLNGETFVKTKVNEYDFTAVSMGNPHAVSFVESLDFDISKIGPTIENNSNFPNKVNVEFIQVINRNEIKMRVWERGAGETLACGTGASSSVVASYLNGYTERKVLVNLLGGNLEIEWNKDNNHIYMTGPAREVFEGEIDLN